MSITDFFAKRYLALGHRRLKNTDRIGRLSMYLEIGKHKIAQSPDDKVLAISHSKRLCNVVGFQDNQITDAIYPDVNWLNLPFPDASFDAVVSDQVLEHVEGQPQQAIDETYRVLKPGGHAVIATCLLNPIHDAPGDFWRFTPYGLKLLCKGFSSVITYGGFGNPKFFRVIELGHQFTRIPRARWHPLHRIATTNHPLWPMVVWVIARK